MAPPRATTRPRWSGDSLISPADVGKRVSLQFFDDDGHRTEAVGVLERAEVASGEVLLHVRKRDDTMVTVPLRRVRFGKVIPAARR